MSTFKRCDRSVAEMAMELIETFHQALHDHEVKIDYLFAYGERDEKTDALKSPAIVRGGVPCRGLTRKLSLKDRAKGMGDAEITLDGDYWEVASDAERKALLDHELHHLIVTDKTDDLHRPKLVLRPHDFEFGWFAVIAERHGVSSQERQQAKLMMDEAGQYFWPLVAEPQPEKSRRFSALEISTP